MFTHANQVLGGQVSIRNRKLRGIKSQISQCLDNQAALRKVIESPDSKPLEIAQCVRAWNDAADRLRILRGKPLPGAFQPEKEKRRQPGRRKIAPLTPEQIAADMGQAA